LAGLPPVNSAAMNYGFWLSIIKVISEVLTAGFGVLGLLTEFKTDVELPNGFKAKRVTLWGWVALTGIVVSFMISGTTTALEHQEALKQEHAHQKEIRRLSRPIGVMSANTLEWMKPFDEYSYLVLDSLKRGDDDFGFAYIRRLRVQHSLDRTPVYSGTLLIYEPSISCDQLARSHDRSGAPHIEASILPPDPTETKSSFKRVGEQLTLSRDGARIRLEESSPYMTRVEDLYGSTVVLRLPVEKSLGHFGLSTGGVQFTVDSEKLIEWNDKRISTL
jgi:hypothetical protein